jgi:hypothetical protein
MKLTTRFLFVGALALGGCVPDLTPGNRFATVAFACLTKNKVVAIEQASRQQNKGAITHLLSQGCLMVPIGTRTRQLATEQGLILAEIKTKDLPGLALALPEGAGYTAIGVWTLAQNIH